MDGHLRTIKDSTKMGCACKNKRKNMINQEDITVEPITASFTNVYSSLETGKIVNISNYDKDDIALEPVVMLDQKENKPSETIVKAANIKTPSVEEEALRLGLKQCYLCTKKHLAEAQILFSEYHTGYPAYIKNLIESVRVSETDIRKAFLAWQRIMAQMNMSEIELLGKDANILSMKKEHVVLANKIREERLKLSDDPLYSPDFDNLLLDVHILQHKVLESIV